MELYGTGVGQYGVPSAGETIGSSPFALDGDFDDPDGLFDRDEEIVGVLDAGAEEIDRPVRPLVQRDVMSPIS